MVTNTALEATASSSGKNNKNELTRLLGKESYRVEEIILTLMTSYTQTKTGMVTEAIDNNMATMSNK